MGVAADIITQVGNRSLVFAGAMIQSIPDSRFARLPLGADGPVVTNHPAHAVGHLCLYPSRVLSMGWEDDSAVKMSEELESLFRPGAECVDDPDGSIYPSKPELAQRLLSSYKATLETVSGWSDEKLAGSHSGAEAYQKMFPSLGIATNFLLGAHMMLHLGQVSAWRRIEGLGPVM